MSWDKEKTAWLLRSLSGYAEENEGDKEAIILVDAAHVCITHFESTLAEKDAEIAGLEAENEEYAETAINDKLYIKDRLAEIDELQSELTALRKQLDWKNVDSDRPTENGLYAVCNDWEATVATWVDEDWHIGATISNAGRFTHYIKLPDRPCFTPPDTSQPIENQGIWSYNIITPPDTKEATE